ncbi:MAG: four helix bundle protein [Candidatus Pacebacteria bacterium]|nr:four helix bundle protein [Candidatus Paceibacterota bacterium]
MGTITNYKDLIVWKKSITLCKNIYTLTHNFPKEELYGLVSQIKRSAVSIPSNIAEGYARNSTKEFVQFLHIAYGSASELETQIEIAKELEFISEKEYNEINAQLIEILKMLNVFIQRIKDKLVH